MKISKGWLIAILLIAVAVAAYFLIKQSQENSVKKQEVDRLTIIRNNWRNYIHVNETHYVFSALGGIEAFSVPVENNTDYLLDKVIVHVSYIKTGGGSSKEEDVPISDIPPHSIRMGQGPSSSRGTSINMQLTEVISRGLHLCYPSGNGEASDPYFCQ